MTTEPMLDRRLRELMAELASPGDTAPAIDHVLSVTRLARPEPRWRVLLKERPMRTQSALLAGSPPMRMGLILAVVAILLALAAAVVVGTLVLRPAPLPPAYGPAGNGILALAVGGDIVTMDATGTRSTPITSGPEDDGMPSFSRDGTRIAFVRHDRTAMTQQLMVINADGTGLHPASPELIEVQSFDWSPAGERLALLGDIRWDAPTPSVFIATSGGTEWVELDLGGLKPDGWVSWRPPAGDELVFRANPASGDPAVALYAVAAGGGVARALMEPALAEPSDASAVSDPELSPDGRSVTYYTWGPNAAGDVNAWGRVLDLDGGGERIATTWGGSSSPVTPDGRFVVGIGSRLEIEPIDGSAASRSFGPEFDTRGVHLAISPDGTTVLVTESSGARTLVDIESGAATALDVSSDGPLSWQRVALP
jgi:dipeptidyl aminopeptidase/acylaminoacyl peptidase